MSPVDAEALIADLDADQRAAVTAGSRLVAVVAGAGSGKTRVLTRRVAHRIATGDADAAHTLVLTFTREAAGELRRRLRSLGLREHVEAGTFHSVMLGVLRRRWSDADRRPSTVVADRRRLVGDALRAASAGVGRRDVEVAVAEIDWAMARGIGVGAYEAAARRAGRRPTGGVERAAAAYGAYRDLKRSRGVIDFDDVLMTVLDEADRDPEFGEVLRWRFRHLHVDEAQDLNPVQHRLVDLLRRGRDDLFLVGDPAQAIYGFNGADPRVLTEVEETFPGIEIVRLPVNHRCTPPIVGIGTHVLGQVGDPGELRSARHGGVAVAMVEADDEHDEAARVARQIVRGDPQLVRSGQVAVLARTNAQLALIERAVLDVGLSVRRRAGGAGSALEAAMRLATANTSPSGLRAWADDTLADLDGLRVAEARVADVEARSAETASSTRRRRPSAAERADAAAGLEAVVAERRVADAALEFLRDRPRGDGAEFRSWVATTSPFDDGVPDGVDLLTFHASKGREWHTVFVTGVESSLVPHKSATTNEARAEEARLLYVALTRASDVLTVTGAARRGGYARTTSPFLDGVELSEPDTAPPPLELLRRTREASPIHRLRAWREEAARRARILPSQLVSDHDLSAIARRRPTDIDDLVASTSLGAITAERLGPEILATLHDGAPA